MRQIPEYRVTCGLRTPFGDWLVSRAPHLQFWARVTLLNVGDRTIASFSRAHGVTIGRFSVSPYRWGMARSRCFLGLTWGVRW